MCVCVGLVLGAVSSLWGFPGVEADLWPPHTPVASCVPPRVLLFSEVPPPGFGFPQPMLGVAAPLHGPIPQQGQADIRGAQGPYSSESRFGSIW